MAAGILVLPQYMPARDRNARLVSGARLTVWMDLTTTKAQVFADSALTTPLANPVIANSSGQFPLIWADAGDAEDAVLYTLAVSGPDGKSIGNPAVFSGWQPSLDADVANIVLTMQAAATASLDAARAEAALDDILALAAAAPGLPSIVNKADIDGDNIVDPEAFREAIGANYVKAGDDPLRNRSQITVPFFGDGIFRDNVLGIRNNSIGFAAGAQSRGNAVINFLDNTGLEKAAVGYSRNSGQAPNHGYYGDLFFTSFGNPFASDGFPCDWGITCEMKAGSPFWGGAQVSYFPIRISSQTGEMELSTNGGIAGGKINFKDDARVGTLGTPRVLSFPMTTTSGRIRERGAADQLSITTNIVDPASGASPTPDNATIPPWEMRMGGALDRVSFGRWNAGLGASYTEVFSATNLNFQIGQTATSAGADGRLAVTGGAAPAITGKVVGNSGQPALVLYNDGASGNQTLATFATDATYTARGGIAYNRAGGVIAFNTTSDYRAKEVFGPIEDGLSRVLDLNPLRGRMHGAEADMDLFVAHEVNDVAPYAVTGTKDAVDEEGNPIMQGLDLSKLAPLLVAAIQELAAKVEALEAA